MSHAFLIKMYNLHCYIVNFISDVLKEATYEKLFFHSGLCYYYTFLRRYCFCSCDPFSV